mmetsp:Transcript_106790/g.319272  ORF Transcript_106790/g.319272 Transcript_106790/m.319272 type:complete len:311 (+) Transcript_106790:275-1207(+)
MQGMEAGSPAILPVHNAHAGYGVPHQAPKGAEISGIKALQHVSETPLLNLCISEEPEIPPLSRLAADGVQAARDKALRPLGGHKQLVPHDQHRPGHDQGLENHKQDRPLEVDRVFRAPLEEVANVTHLRLRLESHTGSEDAHRRDGDAVPDLEIRVGYILKGLQPHDPISVDQGYGAHDHELEGAKAWEGHHHHVQRNVLPDHNQRPQHHHRPVVLEEEAPPSHGREAAFQHRGRDFPPGKVHHCWEGAHQKQHIDKANHGNQHHIFALIARPPRVLVLLERRHDVREGGHRPHAAGGRRVRQRHQPVHQ